MSNNFIKELEEFLKNLKISTYEINSYISLLPSKNLTAREICRISGVPYGRIYDVLDALKEKGMIKIQDSRPKKYIPLPPNLAFHNLIDHLKDENEKQITSLVNKAKELETKLYNSEYIKKRETSRIFWSTAIGLYSIESLYLININELHEELLLNAFLNENTIKRLPFLKNFHEAIKKALSRGVQVKYLCCFENNDPSSLFESKDESKRNLYNKILEKFELMHGLSSKIDGFEIKYTYKKIPIYYDIFDKKRVILKLQNPLNPSEIFACLNVLDDQLAIELRKKFLNIWLFDGIE